MVSPKAAHNVKKKKKNRHTQETPRMAEMLKKGMISVDPDSCTIPYIKKH